VAGAWRARPSACRVSTDGQDDLRYPERRTLSTGKLEKDAIEERT